MTTEISKNCGVLIFKKYCPPNISNSTANNQQRGSHKHKSSLGMLFTNRLRLTLVELELDLNTSLRLTWTNLSRQ